MPFGLSNAPRTFQKAMQDMFKDLKFVKVYLDDLLIYSLTEEDHCQHVIVVLERLMKSEVSLNFEKSNFFCKNVVYLGHEISEEGIKPNISNTERIIEISKSKKQLQRILGLLNWYRPYLESISIKLIELYDLLKKNTKFVWKLSYSEILQDINEQINCRKILHYLDIHKEFTLETDASDKGVGAVLKQENKIIGFYSSKLSDCEKNYTVVEKEN